ncbi:MAG: hypothetical protein JWO89_1477 [Verrucomicrobiaceae bacterium]|nr:hypothetical protein [Verrucomicrobiaceae bacterium]
MRKTLNGGWWTVALAAMMAVSGCKKQPAAASASASTKTPDTIKAIAASAVEPASRAASLGFAAHLPPTTEAYIGTINLPAHAAALKDTNYFKDLTAFLDDRVPAPAATAGAAPKTPAKPKVLEKLAGNDFFISLGKGAAKSLSAMQKFSAIYSEVSYQMLMRGTKPGAQPGPGPSNPLLLALLEDPELIKRLSDALTGLELPPLMIGIRSDKPVEVLKELLPEEMLAMVRKKAKVSQVTTNLSGSFTLIEGTGKNLLDDDMRKLWLGLLPPEAESVKPALESALTALQAKTFAVSYGTAGGYVIVTLGSSRPDLQFITEPGASLAARPELSVLAPYQSKNLVAVSYMEGNALQSLQDPEPIQPMLRGLVAGLKKSPVFADMAKILEPKVAALAPLERQMHTKVLTTLVGVAWWDKGLHVEVDGGLSPRGLEGNKPLKFASLVDEKNVVFAADYHGDPHASAAFRSYAEAWAEVLRVAGLELAKANLFGENGGKMSTWVDLEIVPQIVSFYAASKTMYGKGLGNEHAWVMDLGGRMPALPGLPPPDPKAETKMLRVAGIDDVLDRKLIGDSWAQMNIALNGVAKAFPMLGGVGLPPAEVSSKSGTTFYNYQLPFESDDLTLCSGVNDKVFMLGTSKNLQEDIAARLLRAEPSPGTPTMLWRMSWPKVREAIKGFSPSAPAEPAADNMKAMSKWMAPLGEMRGRVWIDAGHVRNSITWDLKDVTKFD